MSDEPINPCVSGFEPLHAGAGRRTSAPEIMGSARPVVQRRLPGGARVIVVPTPAGSDRAPVAIELWILAGTSAESRREHGCAHLLEHMLFKPTDAIAPTDEASASTDIAGSVEALGGDVNAFTSHDETVFHATVPAVEVERGMEALIGPVVSPRFDPDELQREIKVVVEEIKQYDDDPSAAVVQDLLGALYGRHSYGRPVLGRASEVRSHDARRLRRFHRRLFTSQRAALIVVGPVDPDRIVAKAQSLLEPLPEAGRIESIVAPRPLARPRLRVRQEDVNEAHLALAWQAPPLPHRDACALEIASVALGYGEASRLMSDTRRAKRSVTDAHASFYAARWGSSLVINAHTPEARLDAALADLLDQVEQLRLVSLEDEELRRARAVLHSDVVYRRETVQGLAHAIGYQISLTGDLEGEQRYFEALSDLSPSEIRQACHRYLSQRRLAMSVVVPQRGDAKRHATKTRKRMEAALARPSAQTRTAVRRRRSAGVEYIDLPGGLRIRALREPGVPMAAGWLVWPGGLRLESARDAGSSAMTAELLTRGCEAIEGDALAREVEGVAAVLEGFAGRNSLGMHFECLTPHVETMVRRMLQCCLAPSFDAEELDEERRVALEDLAAEADNLAGLAFRNAYESLYRGHPFRRRRRGTKASLQRMSSARLHNKWREYPLGRAVLGLCGDLDLDAVAAMVETILPDGPAPPAMPDLRGGPPRYPKRPVHRRVQRSREQAHVAVVFPGLTLDDSRVWALDVLTTLLGGQAGRLFEALRERRGLVYTVSVSSAEGIDAGHVAVHAATSRDQQQQALQAIFEELDKMVRKGPSPTELDRTKAWLVGQYEVEIQRRSRVASQLAFDEAYGLGAHSFTKYPRRIEAVSRRQVLEVARHIIDPIRAVTVQVG